MSIEADFATLLSNQTSITGSVPGKTVRVFAGAAPQKLPDGSAVEPPYIVVEGLGRDFLNVLDPVGAARDGLKQEVLDIDCKARTKQQAGTIEKVVAQFLDDYTGTSGESAIKSIYFEDCGSDEETPEHGEGLPIFVKTLSAEVMYV